MANISSIAVRALRVNRLMRILAGVTAVAAIAAVWVTIAAAVEKSPNDMVEEAVTLLAERLDGNREALAADKETLYAMIDDVLLPRFDRNAAARAVLGKHRGGASAEQIQRFTDAFYKTLLQRYSEGLLEFETDQIEILPFRGSTSGRMATVKTIVRLDDGTKVPVNYILANQKPGWLMIDVSIEGVSYVRNFRAELDEEVRATSLTAMIERLEADAGISPGE